MSRLKILADDEVLDVDSTDEMFPVLATNESL